MNQSLRIPTLLFLHSRRELTETEEMELANWRRESEENEQLFREVSDPDSVRAMMAELYRNREQVFEKLKLRIPYLSDAKLSNQVGFDPGPDYYIEVEERLDFPEKYIQESGLSKADFWASRLEAMQSSTEISYDDYDSADPKDNSRVEDPDMPYESKAPRPKRKSRTVRILVSVAAAATVVLGILVLTANSGSGRFQALMISPGGNKTAMDEFHRGFLAGEAHIRFEKSAQGEPVYIFSNHAGAAKGDNFILETSTGNEFILKLPDGTQVWMSTRSAITFPANFSQDTINLKVQGEIYFESSPNSGKHYTVSTNNRSRDAGPIVNLYLSSAHFSLSAYPEDSLIRLDIASGTVQGQWESNVAFASLQLQERNRVSILNSGVSSDPNVSQAEITALRDGVLFFDDSDIRTILSAVSRWYDVDIRYEGGVPDRKYNLHVPIGSDLSVIGEQLKKQGAPVLIQGNRITVFK